MPQPLPSLSVNLQGRARSRWALRALSFGVWAGVGVCAVFWGLRLGASRVEPSTAAPVWRAPDPVDPQAVARLLGAAAPALDTPATAGAASRLVLTGIVAAPSGAGSALIAIDGRPPRPVRVGRRVQGDLWLQSVQGRTARLGPAPEGPTSLTLELPPLPEASRTPAP